MIASHVTKVLPAQIPKQHEWNCACGAKGEGYPTPSKAERGADVHRALVLLG